MAVPRTRLTKLLKISTKKYLITKSNIVRLTVEWFMNQENSRWPARLGWKHGLRISRIRDVLSMENKMAAGDLGAR